jgi:ubiquinone/menaquinone biosynthesis C-methylase UbiE
MMWFDKENPKALYCDRRKEEYSSAWGSNNSMRHISVDPDVVCDFTQLPFSDNSFYLVVFDPPHLINVGDESWTRKAYGSIGADWQTVIRAGFNECMRVLKPNGTLIFKWSETQINTADVIAAIGQEPLFGHKSGMKMKTHWMTFMKEDAKEG